MLTFGYTGTGYYGLQPQSAEGDPERPTVTDVLRAALLKEEFIAASNFAPLQRTKWSLASRTDKGVHAACAAASVMLETRPCDVVEQEDLEKAGDPAALDYLTKESSVEAAAERKAKNSPAPQPEWQLSPSALARINAALPDDVRVFSGSRVRKRFDARDQASARSYEYLLPLHAVGASAEELDGVLRMFEGTHRFHNFASGLRRKHDDRLVFRAPGSTSEPAGDSGDGGEGEKAAGDGAASSSDSDAGDHAAAGLSEQVTWPLALAYGDENSAAFRSVLTCRVAREVSIAGKAYLVLRISGLAFVLHQIRHMVGAALAVTNGIVPVDVMEIALRSPFRVDISPLVPGCGLMLDQVQWYSLKNGEYEARVPPGARADMQAFKEEVVYPHVHGLYEGGAYDVFLTELRNGSYTRVYDASDYERLRRAEQAWLLEVKVMNERRRAERARKRAERDAAVATKAQEAASVDAGDDEATKRRPKKPRSPKREVEVLPGGLYVQICRRHQILPGPVANKAMAMLKARASAGELLPGQHWDYYLAALDEFKEEWQGDHTSFARDQ